MLLTHGSPGSFQSVHSFMSYMFFKWMFSSYCSACCFSRLQHAPDFSAFVFSPVDESGTGFPLSTESFSSWIPCFFTTLLVGSMSVAQRHINLWHFKYGVRSSAGVSWHSSWEISEDTLIYIHQGSGPQWFFLSFCFLFKYFLVVLKSLMKIIAAALLSGKSFYYETKHLCSGIVATQCSTHTPIPLTHSFGLS